MFTFYRNHSRSNSTVGVVPNSNNNNHQSQAGITKYAREAEAVEQREKTLSQSQQTINQNQQQHRLNNNNGISNSSDILIHQYLDNMKNTNLFSKIFIWKITSLFSFSHFSFDILSTVHLCHIYKPLALSNLVACFFFTFFLNKFVHA